VPEHAELGQVPPTRPERSGTVEELLHGRLRDRIIERPVATEQRLFTCDIGYEDAQSLKREMSALLVIVTNITNVAAPRHS
jgi:hypothetical protein